MSLTSLSLSRQRHAGFTLLEVIVALGIFAIGATAAFALLVAGATSGRRAEHKVTSALIADAVLADVDIAPGTVSFETDVEFEDTPEDERPELPEGTTYVVYDRQSVDYPDYRYDVAVTPLAGFDGETPDRYLVEVEVRWTEKGRGQYERFSTIVLPRPSVLDNPEPGQIRPESND